MLTADGKGGVFTYDLANNLATANTGKPATYMYNALHQRVSKTVVDAGVSTTTYSLTTKLDYLLGNITPQAQPLLNIFTLAQYPWEL